MASRVTLLTDFGTRDGFVGALKGVLSSLVPGLPIDDVSHEIPRGDVTSAQYALARYWRLYPEGTVHLVVVDPGVGTARRALAAQADGRFVVAPDNGVGSRLLAEASSWRAVEVTNVAPLSVPSGRSSTFHGRDVFAPAAARLAAGRPLDALGPALVDPVRIEEPHPTRQGPAGSGVVVAVDRFGNLLTNVPGDWLAGAGEVEIAGRHVRVGSTYGDVAPGELVALVSSDGRVEIAARDASAADLLGADPGATVKLRVTE